MTNEEFENLAHAFMRDTGMLPPGKDAPANYSWTREERELRWFEWLEKRPKTD